jgi:hypothetical protein
MDMSKNLIEGLRDCDLEIIQTATSLTRAITAQKFEDALTHAQDLAAMLAARITVAQIIEDSNVNIHN